MRLYLFLVSLALASSFAAAQFSIGSPAANTRIQRGAQFIVTWGGLTANATTVTIDLMQGTASALLLKEILASNIPAESGRTTLTTPDTITSANNYFIRIRANDVPQSVATQGPITIFAPVASNSGPASSAASSASVPAATSSSAAASSSSLLRSSTSATSASATSTNSLQNSKTSSAPRETSSSDSDGSTQGSDSTLSSGAIAGIAIGAVAGIGVIAAIMICVRRGSRDNDDRLETSSEIFSSPAAYRNESKNMAAMPPPALKRDEYSVPQRPQQPQGNYYSTGYEDAYYNNGLDAYQQQYTQGYDNHQYNNYGYHPAAVYVPALASPGAQPQYHGYGREGDQQGNWDTQQQYPEPAYYNSTPPHPQPRNEPPHSPTSPYH